MGVVDLAQDAHGNQVALKRITLQCSAHEIARAHQRFAREANVLSRLHHPNIVGLIEVIEEGDEMVLVMPYLSGGSLADRVAQHGVAPPSDVDRLGERLLAALAELQVLPDEPLREKPLLQFHPLRPQQVLDGLGGDEPV